jgi:hypothetical protein
VSNPPVGKVKRGLLVFVQNLAASIFIGVSAYGVIIYWGAETSQKVPMGQSLLLGFLAVICVGVIVYIGGLQDRIAHRDDNDTDSEQDS